MSCPRASTASATMACSPVKPAPTTSSVSVSCSAVPLIPVDAIKAASANADAQPEEPKHQSIHALAAAATCASSRRSCAGNSRHTQAHANSAKDQDRHLMMTPTDRHPKMPVVLSSPLGRTRVSSLKFFARSTNRCSILAFPAPRRSAQTRRHASPCAIAPPLAATASTRRAHRQIPIALRHRRQLPPAISCLGAFRTPAAGARG